MTARILHRVGVLLAGLLAVATIGSFVGERVTAAGAADVALERAATCSSSPKTTSGDRPALAAVGASFTAGVGPDVPSLNWATRLAGILGWRSETVGVPGVGFVDRGLDRLGPLDRELGYANLARMKPRLIIIQAGHDDWRVTHRDEVAAVKRLISDLESLDPQAKLVFLTAFSGTSHAAQRTHVSYTNQTILRTIRVNDPDALIINPINWVFPRSDDGLHPTAKGDLVIAQRVARILTQAHLASRYAGSQAAQSVVCREFGKPGKRGSPQIIGHRRDPDVLAAGSIS